MALYLPDLFGVAVFAVSGALTAGRKSMGLIVTVFLLHLAAIRLDLHVSPFRPKDGGS